MCNGILAGNLILVTMILLDLATFFGFTFEYGNTQRAQTPNMA